ncbi:hypothetical protein KFL_002240210 [Klebsormidium nitens]|uniref:MYND-type domain-containing protein n=1 Tax=Klebsormidium nitens TaxID=105231 RepID=A0A1Y1I2R9_KLENI|nr:hypothetical protein KFL_002240210 [Klebsormidium nitens]|eukprot:GAQ85220.1 hypothetical protein KFL_002240210 [Klebsormidium nitens]
MGDGDRLKPPNWAFLRKILEDAGSDREATRMLAIKRFGDVHSKSLQRSEPSEGDIQAAAFVLRKGFMKAITKGLEESVYGSWLVYPSSHTLTSNRQVAALFKPVVILGAVSGLAVNAHSVDYMLKASPCFVPLLKALAQKLQTVGDKDSNTLVVQHNAMNKLINALPKLCLCESACKEIGKSTAFLAIVLQHASLVAALVSGFRNHQSAISLLHSVQQYADFASLEYGLLLLAERVFLLPDDKVTISRTLQLLQRLLSGRSLDKSKWPASASASSSTPYDFPADLRSAMLALVLCPKQLDRENQILVTKLAALLSSDAGQGTALGEEDHEMLTQKMQKQAQNDPVAQKKVQKLRQALGSTEEEHVEAGKELRGAERGASKVKEKKGTKKCSGCEKVETKRGEFRKCAACQNAVYCGRECQKSAWKAGHKDVCKGAKRGLHCSEAEVAMAAAVYRGQFKFELLREAFRKEQLSGAPTSAADEKVTSPQGCSGSSCGTAGSRDTRCFERSPSQEECSLGSFLASFGVVRPDDVSSSTPSLQKDVSRGRLGMSQGAPEASWAFPGAATKRKRVRGALFRQLSREETAAWFDVALMSERGPKYSAEINVGCSCVEGESCQGLSNESLASAFDEVLRNGFVRLPPVMEGSLEGEDGLQLEQCEQPAESGQEYLCWEPEEILDAELTLGPNNEFDGLEVVGGRKYDLPVLMMGLKARIHNKVPHDEGPPAARRKRDRYGRC